MHNDGRLGYFIDLWTHAAASLKNITASKFAPVAKYMQTGTIIPKKPVEMHGLDPKVENDEEAERLINIYKTSATLAYVSLQEHVTQAMRKLSSPLEFDTTKTIARAFCKASPMHNAAEESMCIFVAGQITAYYWKLAKENTKWLQTVLAINDGLRKAVYEGLIDDPKAGMEG